jgi:hypothetical protein
LSNSGAISNDTDILVLEQCTFTGNQSIAGNGASSGDFAGFYAMDISQGGAMQNLNGSAVVDGCIFMNNQAIGGSAATGTSGSGQVSLGQGGAFDNVDAPLNDQPATATISNTLFIGNLAQGGSNNLGSDGVQFTGLGQGGAIGNVLAPGGLMTSLTVTNCRFIGNQAAGGTRNIGGDVVGAGIGGGLANLTGAMATVSSCEFDHNQALGGQGTVGGSDGLGGGIANIFGSTLTVSSCTLDHNRAIGGEGEDGGNGGNSLGGGIYNDGSTSFGVSFLTVTGSSITYNKAKGGDGDDGGSDGQGIGGGLYLAAGGQRVLGRLHLGPREPQPGLDQQRRPLRGLHDLSVRLGPLRCACHVADIPQWSGLWRRTQQAVTARSDQTWSAPESWSGALCGPDLHGIMIRTERLVQVSRGAAYLVILRSI